MDWTDCPLISSDPEIVHGEPVFKGTRLPADVVVESVDAFIELEGLSEEKAVAATLECFPGVPNGADSIYAVLAYRAAHERQPVP